jgi:hypothetical protein
MVARDMAFHVEGYSEPNPTLTLPTNARVTIELRNADAGMVHDLYVESFETAHTKALATGEADRVAFRTSSHPSQTDYVCTFHGQTMRGQLRFE